MIVEILALSFLMLPIIFICWLMWDDTHNPKYAKWWNAKSEGRELTLEEALGE